VEAYFNIAVRCGSQWLDVEGDTAEWVGTETRISWKVAEVMRWENIVLPTVAIPEDGDIRVYLYQIVQVGSVSKTEYVCDYDDVEIKLVDNPALQNSRIYYKTNNPETYTSTLEELTIELGDVATVMSQNAKIIDGVPSARWTRPGDAVAVPLAHLICRELANQYQRTTYRLKGGGFYADASRLATYQDTVNEPDRKFLLTGGDYNAKTGEWNPDFVEINQEETTVEIRVVQEAKSGRDNSTGANSGGGPESTGDTTPAPPVVPVDLGDVDDVIPIIRDGKFEDSGISALRDAFGIISEYVVAKPFRGVAAVTDDQYVIKSQLHNPVSINPTTPNGLSIDPTSQVLSIGLASSGVTGALSGTDWSIFNGKIGGSLASGQVAFGTGVNTVGGSNNLFWDSVNSRLRINQLTDAGFRLDVNGNARVSSNFYVSGGTGINTGDGVHLFNESNFAQVQLNGVTGSLIDFSTSGTDFLGRIIYLNSSNSMQFHTASSGTAAIAITSTRAVSLSNSLSVQSGISISSNGLTLVGSQSIVSTANGNISISPNGTGLTLIGASATPTNTLDVNGTTRIRTISNLGSTATRFLVASATGVVSERTGAEMRIDISAVPTMRTLTINGTALDLSADRSWTIPTHDAVTLGTANGLSLSGQILSLGLASASLNGALSSTDWNTFNDKQNLLVSGTSIRTINGNSLLGSGDLVVGADSVLYTTQSRTASEKRQARTNIGSTSSIPQVITDIGTINNLAITSNAIVFTGVGVVILTGIVAGLDGEEISILNLTGNDLTISAEDGLSLSSNRFSLGAIVPAFSRVQFQYRTTTNRWIGDTGLRANITSLTINAPNDTASSNMFVARNIIATNPGGMFIQQRGSTLIRARGDSLTGYYILRLQNNNSAGQTVFEVARTDGSPWCLSNSAGAEFLTRRQELVLNYDQTVATTGTINDLSILIDTKLLILTGADDLTGVVGQQGRLLRIEARGGNRIIRDQSASSTATNRFALGADLTINAGEVYQFIYTDSRWRRVL
jgi:hypothetical protein